MSEKSLLTPSVRVRLAWSSWSVWSGREREKPKGTPEQRRHRGGAAGGGGGQTRLLSKHVKNVVRLEASTREGEQDADRANSSDAQIPGAGVSVDEETTNTRGTFHRPTAPCRS